MEIKYNGNTIKVDVREIASKCWDSMISGVADGVACILDDGELLFSSLPADKYIFHPILYRIDKDILASTPIKDIFSPTEWERWVKWCRLNGIAPKEWETDFYQTALNRILTTDGGDNLDTRLKKYVIGDLNSIEMEIKNRVTYNLHNVELESTK